MEWYKKSQIYVVYPNSFGDLNDLANELERIKSLGCNAVHILPFLKSPRIDAGFDIADFMNVDDQFGGNEAFDNLLKKAKELNVHIFIDIILNHISDQHEWFQKAKSGDKYYQDFFITTTEPNLISKTGSTATYEIEGVCTTFKTIFPEQAGEIPHWVNHDGTYYFHTFYPQQIDLNWDNQNVYDEMCKVIEHWSKKGVNFRLDAIPFVAKDMRNGGVVTEKTIIIIEQLHKIAQKHGSVFLAEVTRPNSEIIPFFGGEHIACELAYNFELMDACWIALLTNDISHIPKTISDIPTYAQWVTFLRSHDELMLKAQDPLLNKQLFELLVTKGIAYKDSRAVAGRMASFLDKKESDILFAHMLLASLPGTPALYYGDEFGMESNILYMEKELEHKKKFGVTTPDARDVNRSPMTSEQKEMGKHLAEEVSKIFLKRQEREFGSPKIYIDNNVLKLEYAQWFAVLNFSSATISYSEKTILGKSEIKPREGSWFFK